MDPDFHRHNYMKSIPVRSVEKMERDCYIDEWIRYKCDYVSAKRLTVLPGRIVLIRDAAPYGCIYI